MDIEITGEADPQEWRELIADDPRSTFFHSVEWGRLLSTTVRGFSMRYLSARSSGRLVAGMPLMSRTRGGVAVLESMPYGTYGGPLVRPGAPGGAERALLKRVGSMLRTPRVGAAHVHGLAALPDLSGLPFSAVIEPAQVVRLGQSWDELFSGFRPSARNKIRKAEKAGVSVRLGSTDLDFLTYHGMLEACSLRWGTPSDFGKEFFLGLAGLGPGAVQLWVAEHEGEIVAGDLNFAYRDTVLNWGNVSLPRARDLATNNLLHATGIRWAVEHGCAMYSLGSSPGLPGVESFKSSFGADTLDLWRLSFEQPWYRVARRLARRRGGIRR